MAYADDVPTDVFPNYTDNGTSFTIPFTDVSGLTAAKGNMSSGDARELIRGLVQTCLEWYDGLKDADNDPQAMVIAMRPTKPTTGDFFTSMQLKYDVQFFVDWPDNVVSDEPA